jgi:hypothetical protein
MFTLNYVLIIYTIDYTRIKYSAVEYPKLTSFLFILTSVNFNMDGFMMSAKEGIESSF